MARKRYIDPKSYFRPCSAGRSPRSPAAFSVWKTRPARSAFALLRLLAISAVISANFGMSVTNAPSPEPFLQVHCS